MLIKIPFAKPIKKPLIAPSISSLVTSERNSINAFMSAMFAMRNRAGNPPIAIVPIVVPEIIDTLVVRVLII